METNAFHQMKYMFKLLTWNIWFTFNLEILWNSTHQGIPNKLCDFSPHSTRNRLHVFNLKVCLQVWPALIFFKIYGCIVILHSAFNCYFMLSFKMNWMITRDFSSVMRIGEVLVCSIVDWLPQATSKSSNHQFHFKLMIEIPPLF